MSRFTASWFWRARYFAARFLANLGAVPLRGVHLTSPTCAPTQLTSSSVAYSQLASPSFWPED